MIGGGRLIINSRVKLWWGPEGKWWKGTVLMTGRAADDTQNRHTNTSDEDQFTVEDDTALAALVPNHSKGDEPISSGQAVELEEDVLDPDESTLEAELCDCA